MFIKVRRVFTAGVILFLLMLFILPSLYIKARCEELSGLSEQVLTAIQNGDRHGAQTAYGDLQRKFEAMRARAELFLNHKVMDDASVPLALMGVYLQAGDHVSLTAETVRFQQALACLQAIETGDIRLLL